MPQIRGNSFAKIYSVVKMQQICKETKKMYVTHTFSKMSVQQGFQIVWILVMSPSHYELQDRSTFDLVYMTMVAAHCSICKSIDWSREFKIKENQQRANAAAVQLQYHLHPGTINPSAILHCLLHSRLCELWSFIGNQSQSTTSIAMEVTFVMLISWTLFTFPLYCANANAGAGTGWLKVS